MSFFEDEDSEEEFMEKVKVYLNTSSSSALQGLVNRTPSQKTVTFFGDEDEKKDAELDYDRSREELLSKIARLTDLLKESEQQMAEEKDKRKKKEKNLLKLAKELKKRNAQREEDLDRQEELEQKTKYLEHHWILAQKELDQTQKMDGERKAEYDRLVAEERARHAKELAEHETRITELKKAHAAQCDELCREILKANLEADRLHGQLNNGSIRNTQVFSAWKEGGGRSSSLFPVLCIALSVLFAIVYGANLMDFLTMDVVCSPVRPGTTLNKVHAGSSFEAPFWAPESMKKEAFDFFCSSDYPPTLLQWEADGRDKNKLAVTRGEKVFRKNGLTKAKIFGNNVRVWNKKGLAEDHDMISRLS